MWRLLLIVLLFTPFFSWAQSLEIVSHYPASAYVVDRLLPFVVQGGDDSDVRVLHVQVLHGQTCEAVIDPFYSNTFHLQCRQPAVVEARVIVQDNFRGQVDLELENLSVVRQRAPGDGF